MYKRQEEWRQIKEAIPDQAEMQPEQAPAAENFHITDPDLGAGGQKTKFQNNVAAIRLLKDLESQGRLAAPEEQEVLARYVGWGGLPQAFDEANEKWAAEYAELKELLTPEEYASARGSTLNAHYTSPTVIQSIYEAVGRMGIQPETVLEPAMGVGNFFGLLPETMQGATLLGVELDSITGRLAGQLYPQAKILVDGFEHTNLPDNSIDLAVGNVPFGNYKLPDPRYDSKNLLIHDYFFAKTLDKVRPGGIVAFISSKGTLDLSLIHICVNQGYTILESVDAGGVEFVLGENPKAVQPFVTWRRVDGGGPTDFTWGHYYNDYQSAKRDLMGRAQEQLNDQNEGKPPSLRAKLRMAQENKSLPGPHRPAPEKER